VINCRLAVSPDMSVHNNRHDGDCPGGRW